MNEILVFAGTTEGYRISEFLAENCCKVSVSVATEYGRKSLVENEYLSILSNRMNEEEMIAYLLLNQPEFVIDATHPYAAAVTENIRNACAKTNCEYIRLLRENGEKQGEAVYVDSIEDAVAYLNGTTGNILVTTGSKELSRFVNLDHYQERIYARVLSLPSVVQSCAELGFEGKHLICMQGPFSENMNRAMLEQYQCAYLVTKDTGKAGGFQEKIDATRACQVIPVIIGRPLKETGLSFGECRKMLADRLGLQISRKVFLVGIGMGAEGSLTVEARKIMKNAEILFGAERMLRSCPYKGKEMVTEYRADQIVEYLDQHSEYTNAAILLSGDVGFYSGAKKLYELLQNHGYDASMVCGISSVVYFMSKIGSSWDDACIVSAHGKSCNLISCIQRNKKVFSILGTNDGVKILCKKLIDYGLEQVQIFVGEKLSYPEEKILCGKPSDFLDYLGDPLSVIVILNPNAEQYTSFGMADSEFIRGKAPMTKEEIRTISLSKLRLKQDSICYDVGAGTGSVSIEMAMLAHQGKVYAIEKKADAIALLKENKMKFGADHLEIIEGSAPEALLDLPAPTHAFIGGSSGTMGEICRILVEKNPSVRIVINCITLETVSETLKVIKEMGFQAEIVQITAARSKEIGSYHLMMGENPIYIISFGGKV